MNSLYNTNLDIANNLKQFFNNIDFNFSKPQLKIIPYILTSIINAENITTLDISKVFFDDSLLSNNDSIQKNYGDSLIILFLMVLISLTILLNLLLIILKL